jgi:hypothetical protein
MRLNASLTLSVFIAIGLFSALCGCGRNSGAETGKTVEPAEKANGPGDSGASSPAAAGLALKLLPKNALGYIRITDLARVRNEFIRPTHVKDAERIRRQVNRLLQQAVLSFGRQGSSLGVKGETLLQLFFELDGVQLGAWYAEPAKANSNLLHVDEAASFVKSGENRQPLTKRKEAGSFLYGNAELIAVLEFSRRSGLDSLLKELQPKLTGKTVAGVAVHLLAQPGRPTIALCRPAPKTIVVGTARSVESALRRSRTGGESLADSPRFQQASRDWGTGGELFAYLDLQSARTTIPELPFATVTHVAASLRLDGGLSLRAYADESKPFPKFLVRTSREKKFLSRIPADAVFLISAVTDGSRQTRTNFFEWAMQELGRDDKPARSLLPQSWRRFAEAYTTDPTKVEGQAFAFIEDLWRAVLPVKSESAFFIAPDKTGRYGAAFLFDISDREQMRQLAERLFEMGNRAKLPWKETTDKGLTIRYVDFAEIAKAAGRSIPPEVAKRFELQVGYAQGRDLFLVGTLNAIKFAHQPAGKTIDGELTYDNVDANNAIMLSLRPGRILHRTFGVPQVDSVLQRLAAQIPKDSNYAVTLNFEPTQLTFRTNIPFVSLIAWLVTEWQGHGKSAKPGSPANVR